MGMYDHIKCEYPLPDPAWQVETFQTKAFECALDHYTITADGRLVHHTMRWESVPENERPMYDTAAWNQHPMARLLGSLRSVPTGDVEVPYHGDVTFYTLDGQNHLVEFVARFTHGRVEWVRWAYEVS